MDVRRKGSSVDLTIDIGGLHLRNPVMTASGTFGYGREYADFTRLEDIGAIVVKGISLEPRRGNPPPRVVETPCGMLNAIGLENVGIDAFLNEKLPWLREIDSRVIVNILGDTVDEYRQLARRLNDVEGVDGIEVNISCPNVKKGGVAFGSDPVMAAAVTEAVRGACNLPVILKLSPNVSDITAVARAVTNSGADAVSLINTLLGMAIDARARKPRLANIVGGLSGPAVKPVALRMVFQVAQAINIPVIGIGGICTGTDAVEFLLAGASAVQAGTVNFINPGACGDILSGLEEYLIEQGESSVKAIIGGLRIER